MRLRTLIVVTLIAAAAACAKLPPNTSPEASVAIRGSQVIAALRATLPALKQATCQPGVAPPCVPPGDMDKVVGHIQQAAKVSEQLAVALQAVDAATTAADKQIGMDKARALIVSIQASLTQATVSPSAEAGRQQIVSLLGSVTSLLFVISAF